MSRVTIPPPSVRYGEQIHIAAGSDFPLESLQYNATRKLSVGGQKALANYLKESRAALRMSAVLDTIRGSTPATDEADSGPVTVARVFKRNESVTTIMDTDRLLKTLDRRLLLPLFIMSLMHGFDKNVSHAKTMGMNTDLHVSDNQWSTLLMMFFVGFITSTVLIISFVKHSGPRILRYLCFVTIVTGLATTSNMLTLRIYTARFSPWIWVSFTRLLQGLCEGAYSAMMVTYLLQFYTAAQLSRRMLLYFLVPGLSAMCGALYATIIITYVPNGILLNWQWFFLGEGCFTILVASLCFIILPSSPQSSNFIRDDATKAAFLMMTKSPEFVREPMSLSKLSLLCSNPAARSWMLIDIALGISATSVILYLPQLILRLSFSAARTNLLTIFPYLAAVLAALVILPYAEKCRKNHLIAAIFTTQTLGFAAYRLTFLHSHPFLRVIAYLSTFMMVMGVGITNVLAAKHFGPMIKDNEERLMLNTLGVAFINLSGIVTSWVFRTQWFRSDDMTIIFVAGGLLVSIVGERSVERFRRAEIPDKFEQSVMRTNQNRAPDKEETKS